jgi:hypothetical protein
MSGDQTSTARHTKDREPLEQRAKEVLEGQYVHVSFQDHREYRIPAWVFAVERAIYFAEGDEARGDATFEETFEAELRICKSDDYEILDWASNNTNWADVEVFAEFVSERNPPMDYEDEWTNAHREVLRFDKEKNKWA